IATYTVYKCVATRPNGERVSVYHRFSNFVDLRERIKKAHPAFARTVPKLPTKRVLNNMDPGVVEARTFGLQFFLSTVALHPVLGCSPLIRQW
ncbi:Phox-like protein, partial [Ramicandelaber brevisporus]